MEREAHREKLTRNSHQQTRLLFKGDQIDLFDQLTEQGDNLTIENDDIKKN